MDRSWITLARIVAFALCGRALVAQTQSTLTGRISDPSGAVVVGAMITVHSTDTGREYPTKTNEAGIYSIPFLPPGPYRLDCEAAGFRRFSRTGLTLETGQTLTIDVL